MLRKLPNSAHPDLLVGFETSDDAGVYKLSEEVALVQTMDFFTPIVDDPYAYGAISAANALSDVYAMGGLPMTVLNIACFDPDSAPAETWAEVFRGSYEKVSEAGAVVVGGHTVVDKEPKFGLAVTGTVDPRRMLSNKEAAPGDEIYLSKPLGTGIVTTAHKNDACTHAELEAAIEAMMQLNADASRAALAAGSRCATDITGFGLVGHLWNVARASGVAIEINAGSLPLLPGVQRLIESGHTTGGGDRNREHLGAALTLASDESGWIHHLVSDPQTSGGLAVFAKRPVEGCVRIGQALEGPPAVRII